jgi:hypothetical protein
MKKLLLILLCLPMIGLGQTQYCCLNGQCIETVGNIENWEGCSFFYSLSDCESSCGMEKMFYWGCNVTECVPAYDSDWGWYSDFYSVWFEQVWGDLADCEAACNTTSITEPNKPTKKLKKITNLLGQETPIRKNTPMFYIYDDGTVEKKMIIE